MQAFCEFLRILREYLAYISPVRRATMKTPERSEHMKKIGAQLYTVRDLITTSEGTRSTFQALKDIGYDSVQLFGTVEMAEDFAKIAKETGLEIVGILSTLSDCEANEKEWFDLCHRYDIKDIGFSAWITEYQDVDAYIERVNAFAQKVRAAGFTFSYHNHSPEFIKRASGETTMACFLKGFDRETVKFMPDTYWIQHGGYDVRYFLEQTRNRVDILHAKDIVRTQTGHTFAEVGNGNLYFEGILKTAIDCGIENFVVEQDSCPGNPLDSLKLSYDNLKALLEG